MLKELYNKIMNSDFIKNNCSRNLVAIPLVVLTAIYIIIVAVGSIMHVVFEDVRESHRKTITSPLHIFKLPAAEPTKVMFYDDNVFDTVVYVTFNNTKNAIVIEVPGKRHELLENLTFNYWHVSISGDNVNTLNWSNEKYIVSYKSIGLDKPHSIDIYYANADSNSYFKQFIF